jgi:RNA polymerase primary sigma factor
MQEGGAGLLFAARRYDPRLRTPFWGYASFWVRKAMQELVAEVARPPDEKVVAEELGSFLAALD